MHTTEKSERIEIQEATEELARARVSLALAKDASVHANAGFLDPQDRPATVEQHGPHSERRRQEQQHRRENITA